MKIERINRDTWSDMNWYTPVDGYIARALETLLQRFQPEMLCQRNASVAAQRGVSPQSPGYESWKCTLAAVARSKFWNVLYSFIGTLLWSTFIKLITSWYVQFLQCQPMPQLSTPNLRRISKPGVFFTLVVAVKLLHTGIWRNKGVPLLTAVAFGRLVDLQQELFVLGFQGPDTSSAWRAAETLGSWWQPQ